MKHLKRYNEDKNIENLEDFLQEIFDKYHIPFLDPTDKSFNRIQMCYYIMDRQNDRRGFGFNGSICINHIPNIDIYNNIWSDIHKMKNNIEKRLLLKIEIVRDVNRNKWITISIPDFYVQGFLRNISENFWSKADAERLKRRINFDKKYEPIMDDLEDYLQEMFDKFLIKKADVSPTNLHGFSNIDKSDNFYRIYKNNKSFFVPKDKAFQVPILSIELDISYYDAVLEYLFKIKPMVEKRLGREIEISTNMFNRPEDRYQIGVYVPRVDINESLLDIMVKSLAPLPQSDIVNDLEDYLQEIFDKYHLSEIECGPERGRVAPNYSLDKPGYEVYSNMIYIHNIYNIFDELIDDIVVAQSHIEKRLGIPIMLEYYGHHRREDYHTYKKLDHSRSSFIAILLEEPSLDQRSKLGLY